MSRPLSSLSEVSKVAVSAPQSEDAGSVPKGGITGRFHRAKEALGKVLHGEAPSEKPRSIMMIRMGILL